MATRSGKLDSGVQRVLETLRAEYGAKHKRAKIEAYRYNPASIRVRIVDPDFRNQGRLEREAVIDHILRTLPDAIQADITILLLLTPEESKTSFGSMEFDDPTPSRL